MIRSISTKRSKPGSKFDRILRMSAQPQPPRDDDSSSYGRWSIVHYLLLLSRSSKFTAMTEDSRGGIVASLGTKESTEAQIDGIPFGEANFLVHHPSVWYGSTLGAIIKSRKTLALQPTAPCDGKFCAAMECRERCL